MEENIDTPAPESTNIVIPVVLTTLAAIGAVVVIKKTVDYTGRFVEEVKAQLALARALQAEVPPSA